jgi:RimJ/RimL family protein N-acetyltransferase
MFGAVFLVFSDGEPVGFFDAELPYLNEAVIISYGLVAGARGKGIGRIALRRVLIRLSEFPLVEAHIHSANRASRALVESAGFRHTGYSDELLVFLLDREELAARQGFRASVSSRSDQSLETRIAHVP